jgi:hypothetical protein
MLVLVSDRSYDGNGDTGVGFGVSVCEGTGEVVIVITGSRGVLVEVLVIIPFGVKFCAENTSVQPAVTRIIMQVMIRKFFFMDFPLFVNSHHYILVILVNSHPFSL